MSKHTEGPWRWYSDHQYRLVVETEYELEYKRGVWNSERNGYQGTRPVKNRLSIAVVDYASQKAFTVQRAEAVANANLIAAAPELLEALDGLMFWLNSGAAPSINAIENARQAIAKAKGENND